MTPRDESPTGGTDNRAARRERSGFGHLDLPWVGSVPNVGRSLGYLRANRRHGGRPTTPVRCDVVPVIYARSAHGAQSARWSTARLVRAQTAHRTYTAQTVVGGHASDAVETGDVVRSDDSSSSSATLVPTSPLAAILTAPTRAPNLHQSGTVRM
jgi:hypothetical protein